MKKIIDAHANNTSDQVGNPVVDAATAFQDGNGLNRLGGGAEQGANGQRDSHRLEAVGLPAFRVRLAVTP